MRNADTLRCFGWSQRAWARPWRAFVRQLGDWQGARGLEIGAGAHAALAPLMLAHVAQVECSVFDAAQRPPLERRHADCLPAALRARLSYGQRDVRALQGRWDMIVMKSVLGGLMRTHGPQAGSLADGHALLARLLQDHLQPGGWLVTLDNGRTALAPLLAPLGARRNGWRFLARQDLAGFVPPAGFDTRFEAHFGVLGSFSAATRLGRVGHGIDNLLYAADRLLSPLARQHAVHLHAWRAPL